MNTLRWLGNPIHDNAKGKIAQAYPTLCVTFIAVPDVTAVIR
jgi:hypothetical protein